jgi:hypothetical protein
MILKKSRARNPGGFFLVEKGLKELVCQAQLLVAASCEAAWSNDKLCERRLWFSSNVCTLVAPSICEDTFQKPSPMRSSAFLLNAAIAFTLCTKIDAFMPNAVNFGRGLLKQRMNPGVYQNFVSKPATAGRLASHAKLGAIRTVAQAADEAAKKKPKVAVVGAGWGGWAAAKALCENNCEVRTIFVTEYVQFVFCCTPYQNGPVSGICNFWSTVLAFYAIRRHGAP